MPPTTGLVKKDPRCPEVGLGIPKPTSGHQALQHEASSQDIARSQITTIGIPKNRLPKPTSGHQELVGDPRAREEKEQSREQNKCDDTRAAQRAQKNMQKTVVFQEAHTY